MSPFIVLLGYKPPLFLAQVDELAALSVQTNGDVGAVESGRLPDLFSVIWQPRNALLTTVRPPSDPCFHQPVHTEGLAVLLSSFSKLIPVS